MQPGAVVVVGASAGGVEALRALVAGLPANLDAAVLVVLHTSRTGPSALPQILDRAGALPATQAHDGEPLKAGHIYVAPPDHHLLVLEGRIRLSRGPTENGHRPSLDPLFRSAARAAGRRTVAVVLSGSRDDGTSGAAAVAARGGSVLVQAPDDALHPSMPRSVIEYVGADRTCRAEDLGAAVAETVGALDGADAAGPAPDLFEPGGAEPGGGEPAGRSGRRVGHAWSPQSLRDEQATASEGALWMALRALEDKALAEQPSVIVVNVAGMRAGNNVVLTVFTAFARTAAQWPGCPVLLCGPDAVLAADLDRLAVSRALPVFPDRSGALAAAAKLPAPRRFWCPLASHPASAPVARAAVVRACAGWRLPHLADDAGLVVTELVSNAVRHGGGDLRLLVVLRERFLHLSVRDGNPRPPRLALPDPATGEGGRGLLLVGAVATSWGSVPAPAGKVVWATLRVRR